MSPAAAGLGYAVVAVATSFVARKVLARTATALAVTALMLVAHRQFDAPASRVISEMGI